ncbi:hypothetical protein COLO4_35724 [Corchorus olitorius]|uniref:Uncharacterized protein n=1 Tax=Corchorus olitorius TaxID=93759 RepID=A0A1R3GDU3_9ROSI|nr:hypothetical protein COLO4_35724 [Corchorus olitorius]
MSSSSSDDFFCFDVYPYTPLPTAENFADGKDPFSSLGPPGIASFFRKRWEEIAHRKWPLKPVVVDSCGSSSRAYPTNYIKRMAETGEAELILGAKYRLTHKAWLGKWEMNKKLYSECRAKRTAPPPRQSVEIMKSDPSSIEKIITALEIENCQMNELLTDDNSIAVSLGAD